MQGEKATVIDTSTPVAYISMPRGEILKVVILGLLVGLLVPAGTMLLTTYVIDPIFCKSDVTNANICSTGSVIANHVTAAVLGVGAFLLLNRWGVYRALLLVAASLLALWGLQKYAAPLTAGYWLEYYLFSALLYGLAFVAFYWLLRIKHFILSLILTAALVVLVCVVMVMGG